MSYSLKGLATGIGSLPFLDADMALDLIFKYCPEIPFWPQMPRRSVSEGMVAQFSENMPCLKLDKQGIIFNAENKERELEVFYERIIAADKDYFKITPDFALGLYKFYQRLEHPDTNFKEIEFIKCHITGPFTFAASINDDSGISLLHDEFLMQAILKGLIMKALWQIELFKKFNKKIIIFIDEPYLSCFGSAFTAVNREQVIKVLSELTAGITSENVLTGVHCCGNTDWTIFTDIADLDIINFDAFSFLDRLVLYSSNLKDFFNRGGILCWGIVPTTESLEKPALAAVTEKIKTGVDIFIKKGFKKETVTNNLLVSPACGLGSLDLSAAEKIFELLAETSAFIRRYF